MLIRPGWGLIIRIRHGKDCKYQRCGHPESMSCGCFGKTHAGQDIIFNKEPAIIRLNNPLSKRDLVYLNDLNGFVFTGHGSNYIEIKIY